MIEPLVSRSWSRKADHVVGAVEIDGQGCVPILARDRLHHRPATDDPGIVDEDRHGADLRSDRGREAVTPGTVGYVTGEIRSRPIAPAVCLAAAPSMSTATIRAPARAIAWAMASPIPDPAPVISATRSSSKPAILHPPASLRSTPSPALRRIAGEGGLSPSGCVGEGITSPPYDQRGAWRAASRAPAPASAGSSWSSAATSNPTRRHPSDNGDCFATGCG